MKTEGQARGGGGVGREEKTASGKIAKEKQSSEESYRLDKREKENVS